MAEELDEPTLPEYPSRHDQDHEDSHVQPPSKRKRSYASHMFSDSSEPAIFSSDNDPAAENYFQGPRQKKQYRGTWDDQQLIEATSAQSSATRGKRKFERQVDSGVFMGSDDLDPDFPLPPAASRMPQFFNSIASQRAPLDPFESLALQIIRRCVDGGHLNVDLSGLNLRDISNDTIRILKEIVPIPQVSKNVSFTQSDAELSILLSNNQLTRCPGAIFDLNNLTMLSLRGNRLTEIPPAIFNLTNLAQLNVSLNALNYLPIELLELLYNTDSKLSTLFIHPNPFHQPDRHVDLPENIDHLPHEGQRGRDWLWRPASEEGFHAWLVARTPVHYLGWKSSRDGKHFGSYSQFCIPADAQSCLQTEDMETEPSLPNLAAPTKVLSLFELCLQTIPLKYPANTDWAEHTSCLRLRKSTAGYDAEDDDLVRILQDVDAQYEAGFKSCTICRRQVVKPAAQWIEWWDMLTSQTARAPEVGMNDQATQGTQVRTLSPLYRDPEERLVPFLRQACTWACVKDPVRGLARQAVVPPSEGD